MANITVLIIAGYASVRAGLHALLSDADGICVSGAVEGAGMVLARLLPDVSPDVVLLDTAGETRADSVGDALALLSATPAALVVLSEKPEIDVPRLNEADLSGWGYLLREAEGPQIVGAVRGAAAGLAVLDRAIVLPSFAGESLQGDERPRSPQNDSPGETLTPREIEVLELMAQGLPNKIIASKLKISLHTAKFHVAQILGKLNAASRTEAVTVGARRGYVTI